MATLFWPASSPPLSSSNGLKRPQERKVFKKARWPSTEKCRLFIHRARYNRVLEEIKEIPADSWWNSCLPMPLLSARWPSCVFFHRDCDRRRRENGCFAVSCSLIGFVERRLSVNRLRIFFFIFYAREVNLIEIHESKVLIVTFLHLINLWPNSAFSSSVPFNIFREIVRNNLWPVSDRKYSASEVIERFLHECVKCWKFGIKFNLVYGDMDKIIFLELELEGLSQIYELVEKE